MRNFLFTMVATRNSFHFCRILILRTDVIYSNSFNACRLDVSIETINNLLLNAYTHAATGTQLQHHCSNSNSFLQKSWKLRPNGDYIHREKLFKMLISTTYSKIVEIRETLAPGPLSFLNNYSITKFINVQIQLYNSFIVL